MTEQKKGRPGLGSGLIHEQETRLTQYNHCTTIIEYGQAFIVKSGMPVEIRPEYAQQIPGAVFRAKYMGGAV